MAGEERKEKCRVREDGRKALPKDLEIGRPRHGIPWKCLVMQRAASGLGAAGNVKSCMGSPSSLLPTVSPRGCTAALELSEQRPVCMGSSVRKTARGRNMKCALLQGTVQKKGQKQSFLTFTCL